MQWLIPDYVIWQSVPGDLALLDARDGTYHALNESAADIWRAVADGLARDAIVRRMAETHDATRDVVADDVAAFVADAVARGLLVAAPDDLA